MSRSVLVTLRHFYSVLFLVKSVLLTLRHDLVLFCWVPSLMRSILVTLRRFVFPCCGCPSFGVVDFVDFEVLI